MKRLLTGFLTLCSVALLMMSSCKKSDKMVTDAGSQAGTLSASTTNLVLEPSRASDTSAAITFSFTAPKITFKSAKLIDEIQVDVPSDNWKSPTSISVSTTATSQGFSTAVFDKLLLALKLPVGVSTTVNVRLSNGLSAESALYSNVISLTVTPINLASFIYIVGQFNGYSTTAPDSLISATSNGIYTGIINFPAGENQFLILPQKNFNNKYATTLSPSTTADSISYAVEYVSGGGNNLVAPSDAGTYHIILNTLTNTISIARTNSYSAIGSVTPGANYTTDDELKYVNGKEDWEGVFAFTYGSFPGGFKIRQNDDWTWSWGIPKSGSAGDGIPNTLNNSSNDNIPVAASGNYLVTFTYTEAAYSIASPPPSVTATYTLTQQ
jgi:hypothetical protein